MVTITNNYWHFIYINFYYICTCLYYICMYIQYVWTCILLSIIYNCWQLLYIITFCYKILIYIFRCMLIINIFTQRYLLFSTEQLSLILSQTYESKWVNKYNWWLGVCNTHLFRGYYVYVRCKTIILSIVK